MNTNESNQPNDVLLTRLVSAFDEQALPARPSNEETTSWISWNSKLDVSTASRPLHRKQVMRFMAPLAAIAASLAFVVLFWPASNNAFAQIVERMANANSVKFLISLKQTGRPELVGKAVAQHPYLRIDWTVDGQTNVNITDYKRSEMISFSVASAVTIYAVPDFGVFDVIRQLQKVDALRTQNIPDSENSIANTDLFEFEEGAASGRLWSDKQSGLPVRIEMSLPDELGGGQNVYSNFEWDAEVDVSIFKTPAGRETIHNNLLAEPTEDELVSAFRIRQTFSTEPYRADFLRSDCGLTISRLAYDGNLSRDENYERQLKKLGPVLASIGLTHVEASDAKVLQQRIDYLCMKADQWEHTITKYGGWVGGGVKPSEKKPLCWWKLPKNGFRVLYADMIIRDAEVAP